MGATRAPGAGSEGEAAPQDKGGGAKEGGADTLDAILWSVFGVLALIALFATIK